MSTLWTLAKSCPRLQTLIVRGYFGLFKSYLHGGADPLVFPSLKKASFHPMSNCNTSANWEVCSGIFARVMLHQAPFLEDISFYWPRSQSMKTDRHAVTEFIHYFVGFLAPTVSTGKLSLRLRKMDSWPLALKSMQFCTSAARKDGERKCPKCTGRSMRGTAALPHTHDKVAPLMKRMIRSFQSQVDSPPLFKCEVFGDGNSYWHVSLTCPEQILETRPRS